MLFIGEKGNKTNDLGEGMEALPKYVADLIELLDEEIPKLTMDNMTRANWGNMDEAAIRRMAFAAGQRSIVDSLIAAQHEVEHAKGDADSDTDEPESSIFGQVFDPNGQERLDVASVHMAAPMYGNERSRARGDEE